MVIVSFVKNKIRLQWSMEEHFDKANRSDAILKQIKWF